MVLSQLVDPWLNRLVPIAPVSRKSHVRNLLAERWAPVCANASVVLQRWHMAAHTRSTVSCCSHRQEETFWTWWHACAPVSSGLANQSKPSTTPSWTSPYPWLISFVLSRRKYLACMEEYSVFFFLRRFFYYESVGFWFSIGHQNNDLWQDLKHFDEYQRLLCHSWLLHANSTGSAVMSTTSAENSTTFWL